MLLPPDPRRARRACCALLDGVLLTGGADIGDAPGARRVRARELARAAALERRPARARRLPRHAGDERRPRRDADPAPARHGRPRGPPARRSGAFGDHDVRLADGSLAQRVAREERPLDQVAPPPGRRPVGDGLRGHRLGDRRRPARGDRGPVEAVRARRPVAPGGRRGVAADRGAGRGGALADDRSPCSSPPPRRCSPRSPRAGAEEADAAVARAKAALPGVARGRARRPRRSCCTGSPTRSPPPRRTWRVLEARNAGKPIGDARGEMGMVVDTFRYYAGAPERTLGDTIPVARRRGDDVPRAARRGRADHAVELPAHDRVVEARAGAGGRQHRRAQARGADAADRARSSSGSRSRPGIPEGVVNVRRRARARPVGARLVEHPDVAKVAFTGSTEVGRSIAAGAAQTIKRVTLELGGKSANVVFADADLAAAAAAAAPAGVRQRRPGLLRALADPRRARRRSTRSWTRWRSTSRRSASATRSTRRPRWAR